jgi:hypothetical protein
MYGSPPDQNSLDIWRCFSAATMRGDRAAQSVARRVRPVTVVGEEMRGPARWQPSNIAKKKRRRRFSLSANSPVLLNDPHAVSFPKISSGVTSVIGEANSTAV